jgi:hypothetical protein
VYNITMVVERLADRLRNESFTPALRCVSTVELIPPAVYPHATILVDEESFGPADSDVTASLRLRVAHAAGRPADAQATVRELAHQLRRALGRSHSLGGTVLRLRSGAIRYGTQHAGSPPGASIGMLESAMLDGLGVVHYAELAVTLKYHVDVT